MKEAQVSELESLRAEFSLAIRNQTEMEGKINRLKAEQKESREFYEAQINSLKEELKKQKQIENSLQEAVVGKGKYTYESMHVDSLRTKSLETDVLILRQELAETCSQKSILETDIEKLQRKIVHLKEQAIKEMEKKHANEIKELKYMIRLLIDSKGPVTAEKIKHKLISEDECSLLIENKRLRDENFALTQELQYLEFKLKVLTAHSL